MPRSPRLKLTLSLLLAGGMVLGTFLWLNPPTEARLAARADDSLQTGSPQTGLPETDLYIGQQAYHVEITRTPEESALGLMFRTRLERHHGMLFRFDPPQTVRFWMKNTLIPLDIVFVRNQRVVSITHDAPPCKTDPCALYPSLAVVDAAIELPAGTAKRDGIAIGEEIELPDTLDGGTP